MNPIDRTLKLLASGFCGLWLSLGWPVASARAITVTPANPTISVGQTQQFTAGGAVTPDAVSAGGYHTCLHLPPDGTLQCLGQNWFGQLGDGTFDSRSLLDPTRPVSNLSTATPNVVSGDGHTCALLGDGTVKCWGVGDSGQRGDGNFNPSQPNPVTVGVSGTPLTGARTITTRGFHTCALLSDGTVRCWGRNSDGQLGVAPSGDHCPYTPDVFCSSTPVQVGGISSADNIRAITAGGYHTCALFPDGTVKCWGRNDQGQLGDGTTTSSSTPVQVGGSGTPLRGAAAITGALRHTCALLGDGVQCWGVNDQGQLGDGSPLPGRSSNPPTRVSGLPSSPIAVTGG